VVRMRALLGAARRALRAPRGLPRLRLTRRAGGFLGALAMLLGIALVGDALITVLWRDPITAVFAQHEQKELGKKLKSAEEAPLSAATLALVKDAHTRAGQFSALAADLRKRSESGDPLGRLEISRIDERFVFVSGSGNKSLKKGPGHYSNTALPGERGTVAIAGHRTTFLAPFRKLDRMRPGDRIWLTMPYGRFRYGVESMQVVAPENTSSLHPARHDRLVLTTCTPLFSAKRRIVVVARLEHATLRGPVVTQHAVTPVAPL
jgi:sortase A